MFISLKKLAILVTITGTLLPTAFADNTTGFDDVNSGNSNYLAIIYMRQKGIIEGYEENIFKPKQVVNRVEALKILLLAASKPLPRIRRKNRGNILPTAITGAR